LSVISARAISPIRFYSRTIAFREFSNFAPFGFEEDGAYWPTVEHYFRAQKFPSAESAAYREKIRMAKSPKEAKALGQTRRIAIRPDWEEVRDGSTPPSDPAETSKAGIDQEGKPSPKRDWPTLSKVQEHPGVLPQLRAVENA
jgi:NADAR domain